jgi:alpha/beta superfamily hydrolase
MPWRETAAERERARVEHLVTLATPQGTLFGIYTPPAPDAPRAPHAVVLFTRPRSHRDRMWVEAARRLANQGFAAFRFDYHGTGDSEGVTAFLNPNTPYRDDADAVLNMLRTRFGHERFLVVGSCFDARTALSTFVSNGAAVDGMVFFAAPVMELDTLVKAHADQKDWRHLLRALGNPENWRTLGDPERWRYMATVLGRVARGGAKEGRATTRRSRTASSSTSGRWSPPAGGRCSCTATPMRSTFPSRSRSRPCSRGSRRPIVPASRSRCGPATCTASSTCRCSDARSSARSRGWPRSIRRRPRRTPGDRESWISNSPPNSRNSVPRCAPSPARS